MAKKIPVHIGDVFQIPIDEGRIGYGQIVAFPDNNKSVPFICVFSVFTRPGEMPNLEEIVRSEILLAGSTFDAKINHKDWPIVGNVTSNLSEIPLPNYKLGTDEKATVETLDRSRRRRATMEEAELLPFRTYTAPVGFELALKAIAGVGDWLSDFDDLKYDQLRRSSEIVV